MSGVGDRFPSAAVITSEFVLSKCDYFVDVQLWPIVPRLNPTKWLENFAPAEMDHAVHLLNAFVYFSDDLIRKLFFTALQRLSMPIAARQPLRTAKISWASFVDSIIVARVTGERPSDADSGFIFARMARQELDLPESQILTPDHVIRSLLDRRLGRVVFVDDFVGSGSQFRHTWQREYTVNGGTMSFARLASSLSTAEFYYCPLVCTDYGFRQVRTNCPAVKVTPAHVISDRYSALAPDSVIWPPHLAGSGPAFVATASKRAGIPDAKWKGFHGLGLAIAFEHCVPDATLPIFYWSQNGWHPLLERK